MKITADEYLYVWLKGYKSLYSYNSKAIWGNMHGPRDDHTKWSESEKDRYEITYMLNLKNDTNELIYERETDLQS